GPLNHSLTLGALIQCSTNPSLPFHLSALFLVFSSTSCFCCNFILYLFFFTLLITGETKKEMECVIEANAMKKSFYQPGFAAEEVMGSNNGNINCGFGADDSFVDEFLNFSKEGQDDEEFVEEEEEEKDFVSVSSQENNIEVSFKDAFDSLGSELCVPTDDLADLEWVSHFVDDSFNGEEFSFSCPKTTPTPNQELKTQTPKESKSFSSVPISGISSFKTFSIPPKRSRTKRTRTTNGRRIWSLGSPPSFSESSSTTTSSSSTSSSSPTSCLIFTNPQTIDFLYYLPEKKKQKPKSKSYENQNPQFQQQYQRRCSHCGVQKTPQWRTGPMGAKTLCNACGVRFKSGRLLPEYRPACSPTFSSDVHSNNHRKVLEMRKKKETITGSDSGMVPAVHSF
ncbi:hypothetical protein MKW94_021572, partial [Papaver nudicaule]|nr:hypothetical protein [Papaver nudicaule]